jgi:thioredoxin reductase (NADPH)
LPHIIAEKILQERVLKHENVAFHLGHRIIRFEGDENLTGIVVAPCLCDPVTRTLTISGKEKPLPVDGAFIFIGYTPNTAIFKELIKLDEKGYVVADEHNLSTSLSGLFAVGDVRQKALRQVATAVGDGALAVHSVQLYLQSL